MPRRTISDAVLTVLSQATIDGPVVRLTMQLERKLYEQTNTVLNALGGTWNRKMKGHVFTDNPVDRLEAAMLTGEYSDPKQDFGFFPTPPAVVDRLLKQADVRPGMRCLEPSAGRGAIANELAVIVGPENVLCCELQAQNAAELEKQFPYVWCCDFLTKFPMLDERFDRTVMNPPFGKQADIAHVTHAFSMLKAGGRLVSVMSAGVLFREDRKSKTFRDLVAQRGQMEELPEDSFKESGTSVRTIMVTLEA